MKLGVPVPTAPAGGDVFWLHLWFHLSPPDNFCASEFNKRAETGVQNHKTSLAVESDQCKILTPDNQGQ